ncbi:MAG: hypothetical protein ACOC0O_01855, partial [Spirochaetota bacterium]
MRAISHSQRGHGSIYARFWDGAWLPWCGGVASTFSYVLATDARRTELFPEINLQDTKIIRTGDWGIRPTDFNEDEGTLSFTLSSDLPITRFTIRDESGEQVGGIVYVMNGEPVVEMPEELFDAPVELELQFLEPL